MKRATFASIVRLYTGTNSTTLSDSDLLLYANAYRDEMAGRIAEREPSIFALPAYFDLVGDQREYPLSDSQLNYLLKVELKFTSTEKYKTARRVPTYRGSSTESEIVAYYTNDEPYYWIARRAIQILSGTIIAVTNGGRIIYSVFPADWSDMTDSTTDMATDPTSTSAGFPRAFHELLARRVSIGWKSAPGNAVPLSDHERAFEKDFIDALDSLRPVNFDLDTTPSPQTRTQEWNYGYNL